MKSREVDARDCERFRERLDRWAEGDLTSEGEAELSAHAAVCEACAQELALYRRLGAEREEATAAHVPEAWAEEMAVRVGEALPPNDHDTLTGEGVLPRGGVRKAAGARGGFAWPRWALTALAAGLIVTNLLMLGRMRQLEARQARLLESLGSPAVETYTPPAGGRTVAGLGATRFAGGGIFGSEPTVGGLRRMLRKLPPGATLLDARDAAAWRAVLERSGMLETWPLLGTLEWTDGVQAGEAAELLSRLPLSDGRRIDEEELSEWLRGPGAYVEL